MSSNNVNNTSGSPTNGSNNSNNSSGGVGSGGIAKVLVVGNVATGKTSVINRFARNKFSKDYQTTIGVDFALKRVKAGGAELNVQLWDIAGQERFAGLSRIFYTHAVAAIIVYDITARDTYEAVIKWKQDIDNKVFLPSGAKIPVLLLGNKADLLEEPNSPYTAAVSNSEVEHFVRENNFYAHFICSAKTGLNVKESCTHLVAKIHSNNQAEILAAEKEKELEQQQQQQQISQPIKLSENNNNNNNNNKDASGGCC